jgi:hypothetical protein
MNATGSNGVRNWRSLASRLLILACLGASACGRNVQPASELTPIQAAMTSLTPSLQATLQPETLTSPAAPDLKAAPRYSLDVTIDYAAHTFQGHERLDYTNAEAVGLDRLYLRLLPNGGKSYGNGSLSVSGVLVDGQPAATELSLADTVLKVGLPRVISPGESVQVEMAFRGMAPEDFGGDGEAGYGIYNLSQGVLTLANWYPILAVFDDQGWNLDPVSGLGDSVYSDCAFYAVQVTLDSNLIVAASGVEVGRQISGETVQMSFEAGPMRDFFLVASPDFKVASQVVDGIEVHSYYLPGYEAAGAKALSVTAGSLRVYNQYFGRYPYTELDAVQAPMRYALGVEYPGIFLVSSSLYDWPDRSEFEITTAHEAAHQWWYNVVGSDVFDDPWMDEALATYSSGVYYELEAGESAMQGLVQFWQGCYERVRSEGKDDLVVESLAHFEGLDDSDVYGGVVYNKGALFFKALRERIGDEAFFSALQNYYREYEFQIAAPQDLLVAFENASGQDLEDFYQEWLYSKETP